MPAHHPTALGRASHHHAPHPWGRPLVMVVVMWMLVLWVVVVVRVAVRRRHVRAGRQRAPAPACAHSGCRRRGWVRLAVFPHHWVPAVHLAPLVHLLQLGLKAALRHQPLVYLRGRGGAGRAGWDCSSGGWWVPTP
jgi:hypothetical protein